MAKVQVQRHYETVSREPATLNQPTVAVIYTIDTSGPFEVRLLKTTGWESRVEALVRADAQARAKLLKVAFDL